MDPDIKASIQRDKNFRENNPEIIKFWEEFETMSLKEKLKLKEEKELEYESMEEGDLRHAFYIKYRPVLRYSGE